MKQEFLDIFKKHGIETFHVNEDQEKHKLTISTKPAPTTQFMYDFTNKVSPQWSLDFKVLPENWNQPPPAEVEEFEMAKLSSVKTGMTKDDYMQFHAECCAKMIAVTKAKNSDYTGGSQDPFANFQQIGMLVQVPSVVEIGFLTRMSDKISRIGSFVTKGTLLVKDESVEDTLIDLANYCILFAGYLRSKRMQK